MYFHCPSICILVLSNNLEGVVQEHPSKSTFSELFCQVKFHNSLKLDPAKTGGKAHPFIVALHSCPHCPIVQAKLQGDHSDLLPPKYKKERGFDNILQSHLRSVESSENDCSGDDIMDDQDVDTDGQIELLWLASLNSLADTGMTDRV